jgi:hypothetical protein
MHGLQMAGQLSQTTLIGFALLAAAWGGYTTIRAAEVVRERTGTPRIFGALVKAAGVPDFRTRDFWVAVSDLGAMAIIIGLVIFIGLDETNPFAPAVLWTAVLVQGGLAFMAFFTSRGTIRGRRSVDDLQQPGVRPDSRNVSGGHAVTLQTAEKQPMPRKHLLTRQERARFIERGADLYKELRPKIEGTHHGRFIAISVNTGRFTTADDDAAFKVFADKLEPDDFLWMTRVGSI